MCMSHTLLTVPFFWAGRLNHTTPTIRYPNRRPAPIAAAAAGAAAPSSSRHPPATSSTSTSPRGGSTRPPQSPTPRQGHRRCRPRRSSDPRRRCRRRMGRVRGRGSWWRRWCSTRRMSTSRRVRGVMWSRVVRSLRYLIAGVMDVIVWGLGIFLCLSSPLGILKPPTCTNHTRSAAPLRAR